MAPGLIVATDTAFSSNRFAWTRQIHKLNFQTELNETVMNRLHSIFAELKQLLVVGQSTAAAASPAIVTEQSKATRH